MRDVLVAHDYRTGLYYAEQFGMLGGPLRIATHVDQLRGLAPPTTLIYVNSDNGTPDPAIVRQLIILEAMGCEVDWVGMDPPGDVR